MCQGLTPLGSEHIPPAALLGSWLGSSGGAPQSVLGCSGGRCSIYIQRYLSKVSMVSELLSHLIYPKKKSLPWICT